MFGQLIEEIRLEARGQEKRRRQVAVAKEVGVDMPPHPSDVNKSFHVGKGASGSRRRRDARKSARLRLDKGGAAARGGNLRKISQAIKSGTRDRDISSRKPGHAYDLLRFRREYKKRHAK